MLVGVLALAGVSALAGCTTKPTSGSHPADNPANQSAGSRTELPTAAELIAPIDEATHVEAESGEWEETTWSKTLTEAGIANLAAGIGEATEITTMVPRCTPSVVVTIHRPQARRATFGAFCDQGSLTGPIRFDIDGVMGSFTPEDIAKVSAALEAPVDK